MLAQKSLFSKIFAKKSLIGKINGQKSLISKPQWDPLICSECAKIHKTRQKTKVSIALEASNFIFRYSSQKNGNRAHSIQN